jgi:NADH-quinone oxidoreductase subunit J
MITTFAYLIMILILTSSFVVIFSKDPIQSVLFLVLVFIMTAVLLLLIGAEFLAILLITVYVGAIAILFLFVVMLLNLRMVEVYSSFYYHIPIGAFVGLLFYLIVFFILYQKHSITTELFVLNEFEYNL